MWILIVYILIVVIGKSVVVATGLALDRIFVARLNSSLMRVQRRSSGSAAGH